MDQTTQGGGEDVHAEASQRIRAMVGGDGAALAWVVEWLSPIMASWARTQMRNGDGWSMTADDVVQDVWLRILPEIGRLQPHPQAAGRLTPALFAVVKRVLRNRVIDLRRSLVRRRLVGADPADAADAAVSPLSGPVSRLLRAERARLVEAALQRLSERERALFVRRVFEESSIDELALEFGMTREAVLKARQRVRQRLLAVLGPQLLADLEPDELAPD